MLPAWDLADWVHISGSGEVHLEGSVPFCRGGCWEPRGPAPHCCHPSLGPCLSGSAEQVELLLLRPLPVHL